MFTDPHGFHVIVQTETVPGGRARCVGFLGIPVPRPVRYLVVATDSAAASRDRLARCLEGVFQGRAGTHPSACPGGGFFGCWATEEPVARNVLVVVAEDTPSPALEQIVDDWLSRLGFEAVGVVPAGVNPDRVLPTAMRHELAVQWDADVCEAAADLAELASGYEERRVFVSYSHKDGQPLADRVFHEIGERRFDVFLDRFRIVPGSDFAERIEDELIDKAMVVVVETAASLASDWVAREVRTAIKRRLGLVAVNLKGTPGFPEIAEVQRCRVDDDGQIGDFVVEQHRVALLERRRMLMESVWFALRFAGVPEHAIAEHAEGFTVGAGSPAGYEVAVRPRPADLHQFRRTAERAGPSRGVVIHPRPALARRRRDLEWLSDESAVASVDESVLLRAAFLIQAGKL